MPLDNQIRGQGIWHEDLSGFAQPRYASGVVLAREVSTGFPTDRTKIGFPTGEQLLVDRLVESGMQLLPPGRGRRLFVVPEVASERGRADLVLLVSNSLAAARFIQSGVAFRNETECFLAAQLVEGWTTNPAALAHRLGVTRAYVQAVQRSMASRGLSARIVGIAARVVTDSLVIEAKQSDWRAALAQAIRYRSMSFRVAIAVPQRVAARVDRDFLYSTNMGLVAVDGSTVPTWIRKPPKGNPGLSARLWLAEQLRRALEQPLICSEPAQGANNGVDSLPVNRLQRRDAGP